MVTFRAHYEYGSRTGSGLDEALLVEIGEQPGMRHYDLANRTRNQLDRPGRRDAERGAHAQLQSRARQGRLTTTARSACRRRRSATFSASADYQTPRRRQRRRHLQLRAIRRAAAVAVGEPGRCKSSDPNRDWTPTPGSASTISRSTCNPPRIGTKTEMRVSYDYAYAYGDYFYSVGPALPPPSQLPRDLQQAAGLPVRRPASA